MKSRLQIFFFSIISSFTWSQEQFTVYFETDKYTLTPSENSKLLEWVSLHKRDKVLSISGFTDVDGTSVYNDSLANKRVQTVYLKIKDSITIRTDFKTISFGENFKQDSDKSKNRKVTIHYLDEKDLAKENEILGIKIEKQKEPEQIFLEPLPLDAPIAKKVERAKVGEKITINTINFHLNTFAVVNESRPVLYELLDVMQKNPKLVIEVHGHVCCNPNQTDKYSIKLSTERAKAIKLFLLANGIESFRVSFKGFGSSLPIHSIPEKNETERQENRRVELLIVEK